MKRNKAMKRLGKRWMALLIVIGMISAMIPISVQAQTNTPPYWDDWMGESNATKTVILGENYVEDTDTLLNNFWDDEDDDLSLWVSVNGGAYSQINTTEYTYCPTQLGTESIAFKAFDGEFYSDTAFTVTLKVQATGSVVLRYMNSELGDCTIEVKDANGNSCEVSQPTIDGAYRKIRVTINSSIKYYKAYVKKDGTVVSSFNFKMDPDEKDINIRKKSVRSTTGLSPQTDYSLQVVGAFANSAELVVEPGIIDDCYIVVGQATAYKMTITPSAGTAAKGYIATNQTKWLTSAEDAITTPLQLSTPQLTTVSIENGIDVYPISPSFAGDVLDYTVAIPEEVTSVDVAVTPKDAIVSIYDASGTLLEAEKDGSFRGYYSEANYTYTVSCHGYVSKQGIVPATGGEVTIALEKAAESGLQDVTAAWKNYRNSNYNLGISDAKTPIAIDKTSLLWSKSFGPMVNGQPDWTKIPSTQIIVDDALVVMCADKTLYKLDLNTGEILETGRMSEQPSWGYIPPIYAEGMIICPLANGTIQAFNAKTLESLWIYKDVRGGQALSPIAYSDGYIYTGFWNGDGKLANFVCLSITDENPTNQTETKSATWRYAQTGGFYWAGAVVVGDYVYVGTDDSVGSTEIGNSALLAFNKDTGAIVNNITMTAAGDIRSSIVYDETTSRIYFTTIAGYLCSASVDTTTGKLFDIKKEEYSGKSTCTPIVYKGKIYFATGTGMSSWGRLVVADANTLKQLFEVELYSFPHGPILLSTAYETEGYLYFYCTYNANPGGLGMVKVKNDAKSAADATYSDLFIPAEAQQNYCISSVICSEDGTIYYKNDSGYLFAIGNSTGSGQKPDNGQETQRGTDNTQEGTANKQNSANKTQNSKTVATGDSMQISTVLLILITSGAIIVLIKRKRK